MVGSAIGVLTVADAGDADNPDLVGDVIDDSVTSDPDPPIVIRTYELPATGWTRILSECPDRGRQLWSDFRGDPLEILFRRSLYDDLEHEC